MALGFFGLVRVVFEQREQLVLHVLLRLQHLVDFLLDGGALEVKNELLVLLPDAPDAVVRLVVDLQRDLSGTWFDD